MRVEISKWPNRNLWTLSSGEVSVRPSLNQLLATTASRVLVGSASVQNPRTDQAWHMLVDVDTSDKNPRLRVMDEDFQAFQTVTLQSNKRPRVVTACVVVDQWIVSSPDFPTYWGMAGTGLTRMTQGTSLIDGRTLVDPPQGICVSWADRCVIVSENLVYFSDPQQPRVFDPANIVNPPGGAVYGVHVSQAGSLILCTTEGVYSLSVDAAASGQIVLGVWQKLTDYSCHDFGTTAHSRGMLFGLTQKGYRRIDREGSDETLLDDPRYGLTSDGTAGTPQIPAVFPDYREGKLYGGQHGPIVAIGSLIQVTDLESGLKSWWESRVAANPFKLSGLLTEGNGTELMVLETAVCRPHGTVEITNTNDSVVGAYFGRVQLPPDLNPVVRSVDFATDSATVRCSLKNVFQSTASVAQNAPIIGTNEWGDSAYSEAFYRSRRFNFSKRTDNIVIQVAVTGSMKRLDSAIDIGFKGPGKTRRQ
jgi:hypothetical protein